MNRNAKGYRIGEDHHRAKLTDAQVAALRQLRAKGLSYQAVADKFGVSKGHAHRLCRLS